MVLTQFLFLNSRYGLRVVCQSKEWHDLVNVRALLSGMVGNGGQSPTVSQCFEPNQIAEVHYLQYSLTCHFFVRHTLSEMENFKFQFYVAY